MTMNAIHRTTATGGGRHGRTSPQDGIMTFDLAIPEEMGGPGGDAADPETVFALGCAARFLSAMDVAACPGSASTPADAAVTAMIGMGSRPEGGFAHPAALDRCLPGPTQAGADDLATRAHGARPGSNTLRGDVDAAIAARVREPAWRAHPWQAGGAARIECPTARR